jgi:hypothetical protein
MSVRSMVEQYMHADGRMILIGFVHNQLRHTEEEDAETISLTNQ